MDVFDLFAKISLDTSEYEQAVKGASADGQQLAKSWGGFGQKISAAFSVLGKAAVAGAGAATAAVGVLTKSSLDAYSSFEQLTGGVETLFKESADTVMEYADNAYKTAGMSANQYMETVTGFSATLLQGLAGDTEAAAEYADLAITDMADNANKMGTAMQSIQYAYQGFAKDNYTMLDNLKLGYGGTQAEMARLINDSGVLGDAIQVTADTVAQVPFDKIIEAIHVIQTQLGITGTTAAEAATTIEGSVNSMKAAWENLLTGIADENANLPELVEQFADSFEAAMDNVMPRIVQIFGGIGDAVLEAAPIIAEQIPPMVESLLPSLLNAVASLVASVAEQLPSLLTILTDSITQFADYLTNNMDEVFDVGLEIIYNIVEGIRDALPDLLYSAAKLVTSFGVEVLDHSDEILQIGVNIVFAIIEGIANVVADFGEAALGLIARFLHIWDGNMDSFGQIGTNAVNSIINAITGGQIGVQNAAKGIYDAAMRGFSGMGGGQSSGGGAGRGGGARRSLAAHNQSYWEQVGEHYESTGQVQSVTNAVDGLSRSFDALSVSGAKVAKQTEKQKSLFEQLQDSLSGVTDTLDTQSDIVALEFDIWESSMGDTVTESEKLQKQLESLTAQQDLQKQAVDAARDAYDQIVAKYGETSDEALSFQKTLLQEVSAYQDLQKEIDDTTDALTKAQDTTAQYREQLETAFDAANSFTNSITSLGRAVSDLGDRLGIDAVSSLGDFISRVGSGIGSVLNLVSAVSSLISTLGTLRTALGTLGSGGGILSSLGSLFSGGGAAAAGGLSLGSLGAIGAALGLTGVTLKGSFENLGKIPGLWGDSSKSLLEKIGGTLWNLTPFGGLVSGFQSLFGSKKDTGTSDSITSGTVSGSIGDYVVPSTSPSYSTSGTTTIERVDIYIDGAQYPDPESLAEAISIQLQNLTERRVSVFA